MITSEIRSTREVAESFDPLAWTWEYDRHLKLITCDNRASSLQAAVTLRSATILPDFRWLHLPSLA